MNYQYYKTIINGELDELKVLLMHDNYQLNLVKKCLAIALIYNKKPIYEWLLESFTISPVNLIHARYLYAKYLTAYHCGAGYNIPDCIVLNKYTFNNLINYKKIDDLRFFRCNNATYKTWFIILAGLLKNELLFDILTLDFGIELRNNILRKINSTLLLQYNIKN